MGTGVSTPLIVEAVLPLLLPAPAPLFARLHNPNPSVGHRGLRLPDNAPPPPPFPAVIIFPDNGLRAGDIKPSMLPLGDGAPTSPEV